MALFSKFIFLLAGIEGGYVSAATAASIEDSGGETYKGVSRNNNPTWEGWKIVDAWKAKLGGLKHGYKIPDPKLDAMVNALYKKKYWDEVAGDAINNQSLANFIADWGVNSGPNTAVKQVQKALGLLQDGEIGPKTLAALNKAPEAAFNKIKELRREFIDGNPNIKDSIEPILIRDRVDAFFFHEAEK